jgi:uncharacterized protein YbcC (UPF0753/DUF2309 family)
MTVKTLEASITRLTNEVSNANSSEAAIKDRLNNTLRDLMQSQSDLKMREAHIKLHEAEKDMAKRTQELISREKEMVSAKLTEVTAKFEEMQRDYIKAMKDSTLVVQPSLERHEELRDLLTKIT